MSERAGLDFAGFRLDPGEARLSRDGQPLALTPRAFDVLAFLCERAGRLVTKDELLDGVWGHHHISEGVVKNTIQELRRVLGDDPKSPRCIETVHRRGYRFIAEISTAGTPEAVMRAPDGEDDVLLVGRDALLARLDAGLAESRSGKSVTMFVNGEPGIGKTALVRAFARRVDDRILCAWGQCVEQYGQGEPYLPLLEAINQLARQGGEACIQSLRRYAPTWLAQLPWLVADEERQSLLRETQGVSKDRMLRELGEFLRAWSETRPLLLVLEDLHWSDHATLDAVAYLARRQDGTRLLVLGSYRPVDVLLNDHPFKGMRNDLMMRGLCRDLALELLAPADVEHYLRRRLPDEAIPEALVHSVFERTEGLPLFLVRVADEIFRVRDGEAGYAQALAALPDGLKHLVTLQFDRLPASEKPWLEAAAVCGRGFDAEAIARTSGGALLDAEDWCERQARASHILRYAADSLEASPDAARGYDFIHAYYRELAYAQVAPARKALLHGRVGAWLEEVRGARAEELAAELAMHFERARDYERATKYLHRAALNALGRHATREAADLLRHAVELMDAHLPDDPEHAARGLGLLTLLPSLLVATRGYAVAELPALYERTLALAVRLGDERAQFFTLYKMWMFRCSAGTLEMALALANRLAAMTADRRDPVTALAVCFAIGSTRYHLGENTAAAEWFERGLGHAADLGEAGDSLSRVFGEDILAILLALYALTRHMLGQAEAAAALMRAAHARTERLGHPYSRAAVIICDAWLHRERGDPAPVRQGLPALERLAETHGYPFIACIARILRGWLVAVGDGDAGGPGLIDSAIEQLAQTGSRITRPIYYHQLAEACLHLGRVDEGLRAIEASLAEIAYGGERRYEAEAWLLRGQLLARAGSETGTSPRACHERALAVAREQNARFLELRAACALAAIPEARAAAVCRLRELVGQFSDDPELPALRAARAILSAAAV